MKRNALLFLLLVTAASAFAEKDKNKTKDKSNGYVQTSPATTQTATQNAPNKLELVDYKNTYNMLLKPASKKIIQFYAADTIMVVRGRMVTKDDGTDTLVFSSHEEMITDSGSLIWLDRRIFISPNTKGTYWKEEGGVLWLTFKLDTGSHLPGDTIGLPFMPNGESGEVGYVVKNKSGGAGVPGKVTKNYKRFEWVVDSLGKKDIFLIAKGAGAVPLKGYFGKLKDYIFAQDKLVDAAAQKKAAANQLVAPKTNGPVLEMYE
jgi:hypothetical protein